MVQKDKCSGSSRCFFKGCPHHGVHIHNETCVNVCNSNLGKTGSVCRPIKQRGPAKRTGNSQSVCATPICDKCPGGTKSGSAMRACKFNYCPECGRKLHT